MKELLRLSGLSYSIVLLSLSSCQEGAKTDREKIKILLDTKLANKDELEILGFPLHNLEDEDNLADSVDNSGSISNSKDELREHLDAFMNPTQGETKILSNIAKNRASQISEKMKTISVAPGESGTFQNWGKETFLEEKCFPEKFPYGTGGYLSSCVDNPENGIGFANYCVNQILSCDPKFRNDSTYIFFLLLGRLHFFLHLNGTSVGFPIFTIIFIFVCF